MIERSHKRLKEILKINVAEHAQRWDQYVKFAVMAHNTTYHTSIRCTPSEIFHGRVPYNSLDLKYKTPTEPKVKANKNITDQMKQK